MSHLEIILGSIILLIILSCSFASIYLLKRRECRLRERYARLSVAANLYLFEYDPQADELQLSKPCAELLGLEPSIRNYSEQLQHPENEAVRTSFSYLEAAMAPGGDALRQKIYRKDNSLGIFRVYNQFFYDGRNRLVSIMGFFADVTAEFQRQERLDTRAQIDALTKVYNSGTSRRLLTEYIAENQGQELEVLIILDIDRFKRINDTLGHQVGDQVLQCLGRTLKSSVRSTDFVGRLGGDEFCIYLHDVPSQAFVQEFCERLNHSVRERVKLEGQPEWLVTVSIGAALIGAGDDFEQAYARADASLYEAKKKGRNTFSIEGCA